MPCPWSWLGWVGAVMVYIESCLDRLRANKMFVRCVCVCENSVCEYMSPMPRQDYRLRTSTDAHCELESIVFFFLILCQRFGLVASPRDACFVHSVALRYKLEIEPLG